MKKEIFETVLKLSKQRCCVSLEIESFMKALLKGTRADLNQLHEDLMFFEVLLHECDNEEKYTIAEARYIYLKRNYSVYFFE